MSKHAPAPWTWDGDFPIRIQSADGYYVVSDSGIFPSGASNARLIAAAPDLLAAANKALDLIGDLSGRYADGDEKFARCVDACAALGVAILKAEGRS